MAKNCQFIQSNPYLLFTATCSWCGYGSSSPNQGPISVDLSPNTIPIWFSRHVGTTSQGWNWKYTLNGGLRNIIPNRWSRWKTYLKSPQFRLLSIQISLMNMALCGSKPSHKTRTSSTWAPCSQFHMSLPRSIGLDPMVTKMWPWYFGQQLSSLEAGGGWRKLAG